MIEQYRKNKHPLAALC